MQLPVQRGLTSRDSLKNNLSELSDIISQISDEEHKLEIEHLISDLEWMEKVIPNSLRDLSLEDFVRIAESRGDYHVI